MNRKQIFSLILAANLMYPAGSLTASADEPVHIDRLTLYASQPECGMHLENGSIPDSEIVLTGFSGKEQLQNAVEITNDIISSYPSDDESPVPFSGTVTGGEKYVEYITCSPADGYVFDTKIEQNQGDPFRIISSDEHELCLAVEKTADHENPYDENSESVSATCISPSRESFICAVCGEHVEIIGKTDKNNHDWGEWEVLEEPTAVKAGRWTHTCKICNQSQEQAVPMLYSKVYEPATSWAMSATIAWRADNTVLETASEEVRPATAFVWLDSALNVYDRNGGLISDSIENYLESTASGMIPAFYIRDEETASALKQWLSETKFEDCFVVSTPDNKELVKDVADLLHVRGMIDFTAETAPDKKALTDMIACVNGAHGKVVLLNARAATRENIRLLQSLCATVWVQSPADTKTLVTLYTNGVNGVLVDDYQAAIRTEELFQDDAPSLLRIPMIIGHRGDPSNYPENTLESAKAAFEEGADSIENDIYLSKDGELFIRHDKSLSRFIGEETDSETLTLEELRSYLFRWDGGNSIPNTNEVSADNPFYGRKFDGRLFGEEEKMEYRTPAFREYLETFKDKNVVHDTEIKSRNPKIVQKFKELTDEYDAWSQVFTITFEKNILEEIYKNYPEISVGALSLDLESSPLYPNAWTPEQITEASGSPEVALERIYSKLDAWNATYNPANYEYGESAVKAGRHRGLTVYPWTYTLNQKDFIARDYLAGISGLTTDEPWFASDYIVEISSEDTEADSPDEIAKPEGTTRTGEKIPLDSAELVRLENLNSDGSEALMIWRYQAEMNIDGENFGNYYLYSNPFVFRTAGEEETIQPAGGSSQPIRYTYPSSVNYSNGSNGSNSSSSNSRTGSSSGRTSSGSISSGNKTADTGSPKTSDPSQIPLLCGLLGAGGLGMHLGRKKRD